MSEQYPGGYITKTPPTPTSSAAPGLWTLSQQAFYRQNGDWPLPIIGSKDFFATFQSTSQIRRYTVGTAYNVSTMSTTTTNVLATGQTNSSGLFIDNSGTRVFTVNFSSEVKKWILSTPWDLTTATLSQTQTLTSDNSGRDIAISADGMKLLFLGSQFDQIQTYSFNTAWDLSSLVNTGPYTGLTFTTPAAMTTNAIGTRAYVFDNSANTVYQLEWDSTNNTLTYSGVNKSFSAQIASGSGCCWSVDGTKFFANNFTGETVFQYTASTPYDLSSTTYASISQTVTGGSDMRGMQFGVEGALDVEYWVVAGGGGGGFDAGGGGGAGGLLNTTLKVAAGATYTVTVGAGGTGSSATGVVGSSGGNSAFAFRATGGGGGGSISNTPGVNGGSGGGARQGSSSGGSGIAGQGNAGGGGGSGGSSGGGGGADSAGAVGSVVGVRPDGGQSRANLWSGSSVYYAGGGGGGSDAASYPYGLGGGGGAGDGGDKAGTVNATSATANSGGGGGGGGGGGTRIGGNGGSGIVMVRYPNSYPNAVTTGSPTLTNSGGYKIYTFNASGTIKFVV